MPNPNLNVISWENNSDVFHIEVFGISTAVMIDAEFRKVFDADGNELTLSNELREIIVSGCHDFWHALNDELESQRE